MQQKLEKATASNLEHPVRQPKQLSDEIAVKINGLHKWFRRFSCPARYFAVGTQRRDSGRLWPFWFR